MSYIEIDVIDLIHDEASFAERCMSNADNPSAIAYWQGYLQALAFSQLAINRSIIDETEQSAQSELHYDEWCTDCKEYDQEHHCCPRFNRVIRQTIDDIMLLRKEV